MQALLAAVNDPVTARCIEAERSVVKALESTCVSPLGVYAACVGTRAILRAALGTLEGKTVLYEQRQGSLSQLPHLAEAVVNALWARGAREIMQSYHRQ